SLTLRATEYTVGPDGPRAMPAELPSTTGYTYAVEINADEAIALGAEHIEFSQPVAFYLENFIGFTPGGAVPVGMYEKSKGQWIPQKNGRVILVQDIVDSKAVLQVTTSGQPATPTELAELNITDEALTRIAGLYTPGQSLWRVEL